MENVMIVGYGQIGQSIHRLYEGKSKLNYTIITKDASDIIEVDGIRYCGQSAADILKAYPIDIMHICYNWSDTFEEATIKYVSKYEPELVLIHSTVPIGVTQVVYDSVGGISEVVHSPVMGKHPNLTESIRTFRKIIGPCSYDAGIMAAEHLSELGIACELYDSPRESELAKLFSTTYYGWNLLFMKEVWKECKMLYVNFDQIYTQTNKIYNEGYTKFGDTHFVRPVLTYMGEGIGGHCVWENAAILKNDDILPEQAGAIIAEGKPLKRIHYDSL